MHATLRGATSADLCELGEINATCFSGNKNMPDAAHWMKTRLEDPVFRIWVAEEGRKPIGYITWQMHGGWNREKPVAELEQLAVRGDRRRSGAGRLLIAGSLPEVGRWMSETNKHAGAEGTITVWAIVDNPANHLYRNFFPEVGGFRYQYSRPENMLIGKIKIPRHA